MQKVIAIIEGDIDIGNMLEEVLTKESYAVIRAFSGTEALMLFERRRPDLILLDLMLPGLSGEEILPKIKSIPVIVTSAKVDIDSKVKMLMDGAKDYVSKPFDIRELLARIAVQLREGNQNHNEAITLGNLALHATDPIAKINGSELRLTKTEYAILKQLMVNKNQVVSKYSILDDISMDTPDCTEGSLKTHISNLRKKLAAAGANCTIEAVWGIGFKILTIS